MRQAETDRDVRQVARVFEAEIANQRVDVLRHLLLSVAAEIKVAEIAFGENCVFVNAAGERPFVQRHAGEDADIVVDAGGKQILLRRLIEDVVDHLHGIDQARLNDAEPRIRFMVIEGHSEGPNLSLPLQIFEGAAPFVATGPLRVPDVKLEQVDDLETQIFQAVFRRANDVVAGKSFFDADSGGRGPPAVLRWNFGGDINLARRFTGHATDQFLTVSVAVDERGVDEIHAQFDGAMERGEGLLIGRANPHGAADTPGAIADFAHFEIGLAQPPVFHPHHYRHRLK